MHDESMQAALRGFREMMLVPGATIDVEALGASPAMRAVREADQARLATDWANLGRYRDDNAVVRAGASPDVVFIGASVTENWAQADPAFFGPGRLNRGIGGQTSAMILLRFMADVVSLRPTAVHLLLGTNDVAGNAGPVSDEDFHNNIAAMTHLATANGIAVILGSITPVRAIPWAPAVTPGPRIAAWNEWMRQLAAVHGHTYADYHAVLADADGGIPAPLANDGVHPNRDGYALMRPVAEAALAAAGVR